MDTAVDTAANDKWIQQQTTSRQQTTSGYSIKRLANGGYSSKRLVDTAANESDKRLVDTAANNKWIQQQTPSGYSTAANDKWIQQQTTSGYSSKRQNA